PGATDIRPVRVLTAGPYNRALERLSSLILHLDHHCANLRASCERGLPRLDARPLARTNTFRLSAQADTATNTSYQKPPLRIGHPEPSTHLYRTRCQRPDLGSGQSSAMLVHDAHCQALRKCQRIRARLSFQPVRNYQPGPVGVNRQRGSTLAPSDWQSRTTAAARAAGARRPPRTTASSRS